MIEVTVTIHKSPIIDAKSDCIFLFLILSSRDGEKFLFHFQAVLRIYPFLVLNFPKSQY